MALPDYVKERVPKLSSDKKTREGQFRTIAQLVQKTPAKMSEAMEYVYQLALAGPTPSDPHDLWLSIPRRTREWAGSFMEKLRTARKIEKGRNRLLWLHVPATVESQNALRDDANLPEDAGRFQKRGNRHLRFRDHPAIHNGRLFQMA